MRDILLTVVFIGLIVYSFRQHFVGPLLWAWLGLMSPHRLAFGFAHDLPFAHVTAVCVLLVLFISKDRQPFPKSSTALLMVAFYLWGCVTSLASFNDPSLVYESWLKVTKIQLMLGVTLVLVAGRRQINLLVWVIVLSLGFYGFKGGIFTLTHGGISMVMGPPGSFIEGTNHVALAMLIVVPLMYYLATQASNSWVRRGLYLLMALTSLSVLGTTSRGALLATLVMAVMMALKSQRRLEMLLFIGVVTTGVLAVMSEQWTNKMGSITTHEDHSAQSRIYTWQMIWNLAQHNPIFGGGYQVTENPATWQKYALGEWSRAYSPHSIYFQALAEHGFIGLALYLGLGASAWRRCASLKRRCTTPDTQWAGILASMVQVSIAGFAAGGMFVNLVNFDLPYYLVVLVLLADRAVGHPVISSTTGATRPHSTEVPATSSR